MIHTVEKSALGDVEKTFLVDRIVDFAISEQQVQIRAQLAIAMAKIARYEFPKKPDLIVSQLVETVRSGSIPALELLSQVVKELATMQIASAKANFAKLSDALLPEMCNIWSHHIGIAMNALQTHGGQQDVEQTVLHIRSAVTCSKILRRIIVHGMKNVEERKEVFQLLESLLHSLAMLVQFSTSISIARHHHHVFFDFVS